MGTVLCIDDDPRILEIHKVVLETKGHTVLTALDGPTGIALTGKQRVDLVVLDFSMSGMDGDQVAQVLTREHPTVSVVICTGFPEDIPESLRWFADALLYKGGPPENLLSVIDKLIDAGKARGKSPARSAVTTNEQLSA